MKNFTYTLVLIFFIGLITACVAVQPAIDENPKTEAVSQKETAARPVPKETAKPAPTEEKKSVSQSDEEVIGEFDGVVITKKDKAVAKSEIEEVVKKLNNITAEKDYSRWLTYLSPAYKEEYSKPEVLKKTSEGLPGIARGINLKDLQDYFNYVFVPSRQKMRVDDIKYLSPVRVQVLIKDKKSFLIIYDLEKINGKWLLIPKT